MALSHTKTPFDALVGETVEAMAVGDAELLVGCANGLLAFCVKGDCCSESWFSDIKGFASIVGKAVDGIEELDLSDYDCEDGRGRQESDTAYGLTIVAGDGRCDVIYRCSSNGYYGGWIEVDHDPRGPHECVSDEWHAAAHIAT